MIGLDKQILNVEVKEIDLHKLKQAKFNNELGQVILAQEGEYTCNFASTKDENEIIKIAYLKICGDDNFNSFMLGSKVSKSSKIGSKEHINRYTILDLSNIKNNKKPMSVQELIELFQQACKKLQRYGIYLNTAFAKLSKSEINTTIKLNNEFKEYEHILLLMKDLAPKTYKKRLIVEDENGHVGTIYLQNASKELKMYNKKIQLIAIKQLNENENLLRIEVTFKNGETLKNALKTNDLFKLKDIDINTYLKKTITKELLNPFKKFIKYSNTAILKLAEQEQQKNRKNWFSNFLSLAQSTEIQPSSVLGKTLNTDEKLIPVLLDTIQIKTAVKKVSKNYKSILKTNHFFIELLPSRLNDTLKLFDELEEKLK